MVQVSDPRTAPAQPNLHDAFLSSASRLPVTMDPIDGRATSASDRSVSRPPRP
jgi:hypothetical protein